MLVNAEFSHDFPVECAGKSTERQNTEDSLYSRLGGQGGWPITSSFAMSYLVCSLQTNEGHRRVHLHIQVRVHVLYIVGS